jgi:hypothetical protein
VGKVISPAPTKFKGGKSPTVPETSGIRTEREFWALADRVIVNGNVAKIRVRAEAIAARLVVSISIKPLGDLKRDRSIAREEHRGLDQYR